MRAFMRRRIGVVVLLACLVAVGLFGRPAGVRWLLSTGLGVSGEGDEVRYLGTVTEGAFRLLAPATRLGPAPRFTRIAMQEAVSPESGELDLRLHEGRVILIEGRGSGDWVYSARVVRSLGSVLAALTRYAFAQGASGER